MRMVIFTVYTSLQSLDTSQPYGQGLVRQVPLALGGPTHTLPSKGVPLSWSFKERRQYQRLAKFTRLCKEEHNLQTLTQFTKNTTIVTKLQAFGSIIQAIARNYKKLVQNYTHWHEITNMHIGFNNLPKNLQEFSTKLQALARNYKHAHNFQQFAKKLQEFRTKLQAWAQNYKHSPKFQQFA